MPRMLSLPRKSGANPRAGGGRLARDVLFLPLARSPRMPIAASPKLTIVPSPGPLPVRRKSSFMKCSAALPMLTMFSSSGCIRRCRWRRASTTGSPTMLCTCILRARSASSRSWRRLCSISSVYVRICRPWPRPFAYTGPTGSPGGPPGTSAGRGMPLSNTLL